MYSTPCLDLDSSSLLGWAAETTAKCLKSGRSYRARTRLKNSDFCLASSFTHSTNMLTSAVLILGLLPLFAVAQLITTDAKCLAGYDWVRRFYHTYSLIETFLLADVQFHKPESMRRCCRTCRSVRWWTCGLFLTYLQVFIQIYPAEFNLQPLLPGYVYLGPTVANANSCRCSSVYYSLLSACAYCQGRNYLR